MTPDAVGAGLPMEILKRSVRHEPEVPTCKGEKDKAGRTIDMFLVGGGIRALEQEVKVDSMSEFKPHRPVKFSIELPEGQDMVTRLVKVKRVGAVRPQGPPQPPPSYAEEAAAFEEHFNVDEMVTLNGEGRDAAERLMNVVYESWVKKAWAEVEDIYQVQAKGVKGRAGGEPF